ncbi:hypothetical protein [Pseudomonas sp. ICMP 460]|uniref:hypothetical protein n=1 Tax=Pseudomonas sp. ICMP 460 TaxID=1718917 RepID=UPI001179BBA3|nr:hypothetical protein [Pseudomonas sp. ICMP 460]
MPETLRGTCSAVTGRWRLHPGFDRTVNGEMALINSGNSPDLQAGMMQIKLIANNRQTAPKNSPWAPARVLL